MYFQYMVLLWVLYAVTNVGMNNGSCETLEEYNYTQIFQMSTYMYEQ